MQISKSLLSVFKISCSISVPCSLLLAEDQTSRALNLRTCCWKVEPRGWPEVELLDRHVTSRETEGPS